MAYGDIDKGNSVRALYRSGGRTIPRGDAVGDIAAAVTVRLYEYLGRARQDAAAGTGRSQSIPV